MLIVAKRCIESDPAALAMLRTFLTSSWPRVSPISIASRRSPASLYADGLHLSRSSRSAFTSSSDDNSLPSFAEGLSSLSVPIPTTQQHIPSNQLPGKGRGRRLPYRQPSNSQFRESDQRPNVATRTARPARAKRRTPWIARKRDDRTEEVAHSFGKRGEGSASPVDESGSHYPKEFEGESLDSHMR